MSILSLLGKAGKPVLSPATQARNLTGATNLKKAQGMARAAEHAKAKSLQHATAKVDDLIRQGKLPTNVRREDLIRKMQQHLEREYERIRAIQPAIPTHQTVRKQGDQDLIELVFFLLFLLQQLHHLHYHQQQ